MKKLQKIILAGTLGLALAGAGCTTTGIKPLYPYYTEKEAQERYLAIQKRAEFEEKRKKDVHYFACSEYIDLNENNNEDYPREFIGIKNKFRKGEPMLLVSYIFPRAGQMEELNVYSPSGKLVHFTRLRLRKEGYVLKRKINTAELAEKGGYGDYKAVWTLNGKHAGEAEFKILE